MGLCVLSCNQPSYNALHTEHLFNNNNNSRCFHYYIMAISCNKQQSISSSQSTSKKPLESNGARTIRMDDQSSQKLSFAGFGSLVHYITIYTVFFCCCLNWLILLKQMTQLSLHDSLQKKKKKKWHTN